MADWHEWMTRYHNLIRQETALQARQAEAAQHQHERQLQRAVQERVDRRRHLTTLAWDVGTVGGVPAGGTVEGERITFDSVSQQWIRMHHPDLRVASGL